jgi:hypothetical protein
MFSKKILISASALTLILLISIQPVSAAALTWHSSVKEGASWKWKVSNLSGDLDEYFGTTFEDLEEGVEIEVKAVGNPPTVGDWSTMVFSSSIEWADLYINGTQSTEENVISFLVAPLNIGNGITGWQDWVDFFYSLTLLLGYNYDTSNSTSGDLISYQCSNSGGFGSLQISVTHTIVYDNTTGILNRYTLEFSNTTLSSSVTISQVGGEGLKIPGFEFGIILSSIGFLATVTVILKRKK